MSQWVKAKSGKAHLDLGERSTQSFRVRSEHVIVTACRAHLDGATADVIADRDQNRCSNCIRIAIDMNAIAMKSLPRMSA